MEHEPKPSFVTRAERDFFEGTEQLKIIIARAKRRQAELEALLKKAPLKNPLEQAVYQELIRDLDWHEEMAIALRGVVLLDQAALRTIIEQTIYVLQRELQMLHRAQRDLAGDAQRDVLGQILEIQTELAELQAKAATYGV